MTTPRLLIIEDDYDVAEVLGVYFESQQYAVFHADSGGGGIRMAQRAYPQVILLDLMLPDIDGYETCRQLRRASLTRYIPIIFLTQRDDRATQIKGFELGADDYVTKPFNLDALRLRVQGVIRRATQEQLHEMRTGLPTGYLVQRELKLAGTQSPARAVLRLELEHLAAYNAHYGLLAGHDVFGQVGQIIQQTVAEQGTADDFIGVLEDGFIVLTAAAPERLLTVISQRFDALVPQFYTQAFPHLPFIRLLITA
jgi:DNA-binding response OmpR family regulator